MIEEFGKELSDLVDGVVKRAGEIKDGGSPTFNDAHKKIIHPQVFQSEEEAEFFSYKLDGEGIRNAAEENHIKDYVLGDL
jgi:hypothetical protein